MKKRHNWTSEEVALIETLTPHYTAREAMQWFPGATVFSLYRAAYLRGMAWRRAISSPTVSHRRPAHSREFLETVRQLWDDTDMTAEQIGVEVGLTRNAVAGLAHRHNWQVRGVLGDRRGVAKTTLQQRMDVLNAMMDRVLAENPPRTGRLTERSEAAEIEPE